MIIVTIGSFVCLYLISVYYYYYYYYFLSVAADHGGFMPGRGMIIDVTKFD